MTGPWTLNLRNYTGAELKIYEAGELMAVLPLASKVKVGVRLEEVTRAEVENQSSSIPIYRGYAVDLPEPQPGITLVVEPIIYALLAKKRNDLAMPGLPYMVGGTVVGCRGIITNALF